MAKLFLSLTFLCIFGAVLVKGFDKEALETFLSNAEECQTESGADDDEVKAIMSKQIPSSIEGKCFLSCLMKKYGLMDEQGNLVKDAALIFAEQMTQGDEDAMKIAEEIIETCDATDVDNDHCIAAGQYSECFVEQMKAFDDNSQE